MRRKYQTGITSRLRRLRVGESIIVSPEETTASLSLYARRLGIKIATRAVEGGRRVWRLA